MSSEAIILVAEGSRHSNEWTEKLPTSVHCPQEDMDSARILEQELLSGVTW